MATSIHLHNNGSSNNEPTLELKNTHTNAKASTIHFKKHSSSSAENGDSLGILHFEGYNESNSAGDYCVITASSNNVNSGEEEGKLNFSLLNGSGGSSDTLTLVGSNVGIGTTSPGSKLQIKQDIANNPSSTDPSVNSYGQLEISSNSNVSGSSAPMNISIGAWHGTNPFGYIQTVEDGIHPRSLSLQPRNGNVGIGETSPDGGLVIRSGGDGNKALVMKTSDENGHQGNLGGYMEFRWAGSGVNYNMAVYMKDDGTPNDHHIIGYFENDSIRSNHVFFTGQHRNILNQNITENEVGLIVSSTDNIINVDGSLLPSINESLPFCQITNIDNDKKVFGVLSDREDINDNRTTGTGSYKTISRKTYKNERRMYINSVGEGSLWVCDKNGSLVIGDYISSSSVTGYGMKQTLEENRLMNYTVAKITCDCDFSLTKIPKQKLKTITVTETLQREVYEEITESKQKTEINFDATLNRYVQTTVTEDVTTRQIAKDTFDLYDSEGNVIGTHQVNRMENYDVTKTEIDYDANGDVQYEDDLDENGAQQMVYKYETRFLQADGTLLVDEADYNTRKDNNENVYIACFVGCTYHCG